MTRQVDPADGGAALRAAAAAVRDNGWVVLTSVNAVDRFMGELRDARALGSVLVAAVGTGHRRRAAPGRRRARPGAGRAQRARARRGVPGRGRTRARGASSSRAPTSRPTTIPEGLGHKGWDVRRVEAYRTVPRAAPEPALLDRVAAADALTFAATVVRCRRSWPCARAAGAPVTPPAHVVCIGPTTAAAARAAGLGGVHEAWGASAEGIVDELIAALGPRRGRRPVGWTDGRGDVCARLRAASPCGGCGGCAARPALRRLVAEARLGVDDLVAPLFVREGTEGPIADRVHAR